MKKANRIASVCAVVHLPQKSFVALFRAASLGQSCCFIKGRHGIFFVTAALRRFTRLNDGSSIPTSNSVDHFRGITARDTSHFSTSSHAKRRRRWPMAVASHQESLRLKHADLEAQIAEEERRPHPDDVVIHHLKKLKLRIKDELLQSAHAE